MSMMPRMRRWGRIAGRSAAIVVVVLAGVVALLLFRPVRERVLDRVIDEVSRSVPGVLTFADVAWLEPGTLELRDAVWIVGSDTLAVLSELRVSVDLRSLMHRDLVIRDLVVACERLDLPAVRGVFGPGDGSAAPSSSVIRPGSLPPFPSVAVDRSRLSCRRLVVSETTVVEDVAVTAMLELRVEREPEWSVTAAARDAAGLWRLDDAAATWAPARDVYAGAGTIRLGEGEPVRLTLTRQGEHRFACGLGGTPPGKPGLAFDGRLGGGGGAVRTLDLEGSFLTPGLRDIAALPFVTGVPDDLLSLEGIAGVFTCSAVWRDDGPDVALTLTLDPNGWLDSGTLALQGGPVRVRLERFELAALGAKIEATATRSGRSCELLASLKLRGERWYSLLPSSVTPPDSLAADLDLRVAGRLPTPAATATFRAGLRSGSARLDSLDLLLDADDGWRDARMTWSLGAHGATVAGAADLLRDDDRIVIRPGPLRIGGWGVTAGAGVAAADRSAEVVVALPGGETSVRDLRITGVLGDFALGGRRDASGFDIRLEGAWSEPPAALLAACADSLRSPLQERWGDGAPWTLAVAAADRGDGLRADVDLRLPGPRQLQGLLPSSFRLDELDALQGTAHLRRAGEAVAVDIDLAPTSWIDVGRVRARVGPERSIVDGLELSLLGLRAEGSGTVAADSVAGDFTLTIDDASRLLRLAGSDHDLSAALSLGARLSGTRAAPIVGCDVEASASGDAVAAARVVGRIDFAADELRVAVTAPEGLVAQGRTVESASVQYEGSLPGRGTGRLRFAAAAADVAVRGALDATSADVVTLAADTLDIDLAGRSLTLDRPFTVETTPATRTTILRDLVMSGSLGRLTASAELSAGETSGELDLELRLPDEVYPPTLTPELRPEVLTVRATARGGRRRVRLEADGLTPGYRRDLRIVVDVEDAADGLDIAATAIDQGDTLAAAKALVDRSDIQRLADGGDLPLHADIALNGLPLPTLPGADWQGREVVLDGTVSLRGSTAAPYGSLRIAATTRNWSELATHRLEVEGELKAAGTAEAGLSAGFTLARGGLVLARGSLNAPGAASFSPPEFIADEEGAFDARAMTQGLQLEEFTPLMPVAVGVRGALDVDLRVSGPLRDLALRGDLKVSDGRVTLPDGSWFTMAGRSNIKGTPASPDVTGSIEIGAGVLRLPEPPQNLHPLHGRPVLWDASVAGGLSPAAAPSVHPVLMAAGDSTAAFTPMAVIGISIPTGLRLMGQGLEVVLVGDLELRTSHGVHDVGGALAASRGFFRFLGRTFQVERGDVSFDDGEGTDPALDIALTTLLEGTLYRVAFGGTLLRPTLALSSEPEMPEGDIMAMLLFGRPLNELSSDQEGLVQERATDLVTAYGTAQLEARLSQQLKVDMINLKRGSGGDDALVIGKHLHQKVLLKYEQELDAWSSFLVNLEYFFSRHVKLETMISRHDQSAAAVNWSMEY